MLPRFIAYLDMTEATEGLNAKKEMILTGLKNYSDQGRKIFEMVYGDAVYGVSSRSFEKMLGYKANTELKKYEDAGQMMQTNSTGSEEKSFEEFVNFVEQLKDSSGNKQIELMRLFFEELHFIQSKWFSRIILKNLRIGITLTTINKILKELGMSEIKKFEVQLCGKIKSPEEYEGEFPCIAGIKYDGLRGYCVKKGNEVTLTSRSGKNIDFVPEIISMLKNIEYDFILDGEIMAKDFNAIQQRIGRKTENIEEVEGLHYRVFDILSFNGEDMTSRKQENRHNILHEMFEENKYLKFEETRIILSMKDLKEFYTFACKRGEEGIIVKDMNSPYVYGGRETWWKIKPVREASFQIIGWENGRGKHKDFLGSLIVTDFSKTIEAKVGSGIDDVNRVILTEMAKNNTLEGYIVDVKFNEITENKSEKNSLRFPRFLKLRTDKKEPDKIFA